MSYDENNKDLDNAAMKALFAHVRNANISPSPYLKTRVLAHLEADKKESRQLLFWKSFSMLSLAVASVMTYFYLNNSLKQSETVFFAGKPYVIQIDFDNEEQLLVSQVEVSLPSDVEFVSSEGPINETKQITLPYNLKQLGKNKLPVVVQAKHPGAKEIVVRFLNPRSQLVQEKRVKLQFAKQKS